METEKKESPLKEVKTPAQRIKKALKVTWKIIFITLCFLVYLVVVPLFVIFVVPMYGYRIFVQILQKIFKPDWVGMMSVRDAVVGLDNITNNCECMITLLLTVKGEPDIKLIRDVYQKTVLDAKNAKGEYGYLKFTYYFETWLGFTFWKRVQNFDLANHIRFIEPRDFDDPNSNDFDVVTEEQLMRAMGPIATRQFPHGMSPWEALIIKKYKKSESKLHKDYSPTVPVPTVDKGDEKDMTYAIIFKIHHAIGDGYSIMKLLMSNICGDPLSVVPKAPTRPLSPMMKLFLYIATIVMTPYYHVMQFFINVDRTVWHLPSHKLAKRWNFTMTEKISFKGIRATSKRLGVCVTATLLAGLAGGIHNFLKKKGQNHSRVMRALSPMPWMNHPMDAMVNHWTIGIIGIPMNVSCPRKRLLTAYKTVENMKKSPVLLTNFMTVAMLVGTPNWLTAFWGTNWMTTMILSNFPGPDFHEKAFYRSQDIEDVVSWVPHMRGSAGLGIMFLSYNGGVRVSISIDKAILKDSKELEELSTCIAEEFVTLRSLQPVEEV